MKIFKGPYKIVWEDHCSFSHAVWRQKEEFDLKPVTVTTVGYVVKENKKMIVVAGHVTSEGTCHGDMSILKNCIVSKKKLK